MRPGAEEDVAGEGLQLRPGQAAGKAELRGQKPVSYTHLRAHETVLDLVCRLLLEKKTIKKSKDRCEV